MPIQRIHTYIHTQYIHINAIKHNCIPINEIMMKIVRKRFDHPFRCDTKSEHENYVHIVHTNQKDNQTGKLFYESSKVTYSDTTIHMMYQDRRTL